MRGCAIEKDSNNYAPMIVMTTSVLVVVVSGSSVYQYRQSNSHEPISMLQNFPIDAGGMISQVWVNFRVTREASRTVEVRSRLRETDGRTRSTRTKVDAVGSIPRGIDISKSIVRRSCLLE